MLIPELTLHSLSKQHTFSVEAASTWTPAELSSNRTTFSLPLYAARWSGVSPDSAPNSGTSDTPVGASDFTVPGTCASSSRTVSEKKIKEISNREKIMTVFTNIHTRCWVVSRQLQVDWLFF